jgi:hypothetical protein
MGGEHYFIQSGEFYTCGASCMNKRVGMEDAEEGVCVNELRCASHEGS